MQRIVLPAVLLFLALALGCGGGGSSKPVNSIKIESVDPASAAPGVNTTFTITVSSDLQTAHSAVIDHCFSDNYFADRSSDYWLGCPMPIAGIPVSRGKETTTINNAESFPGAKYLYVFLVPDQASIPLVGVVIDVYPITVP